MRTATCVLVALATLCASGARGGAPSQSQIADLAEAYVSGDLQRAFPAGQLERYTVAAFTSELSAWVTSGPERLLTTRTRVAAAFALESSWRATRTFGNLNRPVGDPAARAEALRPDREVLGHAASQPLIAAWVMTQLGRLADEHPVDLALWRTAVGLAQDAFAWRHLRQTLLPRALGRFPADARLRLASTLTDIAIDLGPLRDASGFRSRQDALRPSTVDRGTRRRIEGAIAALNGLASAPSVTAEVDLRAGYLELQREHWQAAAIRFERTRRTASDPWLLVAADYFAGWVLEQQGQVPAAVEAYRRANVIAPAMRNLAVRLGALLYVTHEREEAYRVLDVAFGSPDVPVDVLTMFERADGRMVPEWLNQIRQGLR